MRTILCLLALGALTPAFAASSDSDARIKEVPTIENTGLEAFDSVFGKAKAIHDTLDTIEGRIVKAQDRIAVSIGLAEGTPIRMSMWELKQRAGGPIEVQMRDNKPYLTVGGTGSDEVKAMLAAVNEAAEDLALIPNDAKKLVPQSQALAAACAGFPAQLNPQMLSDAGLSPLQLPKVAKTLANDVKAVGATPARIENLVTAAQDVLTGIPQGLAATEPPTEAVTMDDVKGKGEKSEKPAKASKPAKGSAEAEGVAAADDADLDDLDAVEADEDAGKAAKSSAPPAKAAKSAGASDEDVPGSPIGAMISDARAQLLDAEIDEAMRVLGEADAALVNLRSPIPATELLELYETIGLVHLVDGNAAAATASVTQALVVDPLSKPLTELGPEYAKLHKALAKSGVVHMVQVDLNGNGVGYIDGRRVEGGETVYLATGKHLVQRAQGDDFASEMVWVSEGAEIDI